MGIKGIFADSTLARYIRSIKNSPRELFFNRHLIFSAALYATSGIPLTWDQGSSSVVPSLPGFEHTFGVSSGSNAQAISNFVSIVYVGCGFGAAISFLINDRIGRLWSFRLYCLVWIVGQIIATFSNGSLTTLYVARVIAGLGIGAHTVTGPLSLVEIAPTEFRGLITVWFSIVLLLTLFLAEICVYGVYLHIPASKLQYQTVWFAPCIALALLIAASFFATESPRWLALIGKQEEAYRNLVKFRGLGASHPRVTSEFDQIILDIEEERDRSGAGARSSSLSGIGGIFKETFLIKANLRRVQQACIAYALAQLSGANSVTSYFVPILKLIGTVDGEANSLFVAAMYGMAKFFFTVMASFFFVDALGRRGSLFAGITIQMISDIYIGTYLKFKQESSVSASSSQAAIAMIFIHGFGYSIGLLILPYVFGAEIWPNHLRSFGAALSQTFHWFFYFGVNKATPLILSSMDNWGAFIFFAGWCFVSLIYVFVMVPETAGHSLEKLDELFKGSWFLAFRTGAGRPEEIIEGYETRNSMDDSRSPGELTGKGAEVSARIV